MIQDARKFFKHVSFLKIIILSIFKHALVSTSQ